MVKYSRLYSYIFIFLGAAALFASEVVRSAPRQLETRLLKEIEVIVYMDESASAEDLKKFKEVINGMDLFSAGKIKTSAKAFEELKKDEIIADQLQAIEREFSPPHSVTVRIESLEKNEFQVQLAEIEQMPRVEYVQVPGGVINGVSKFLKRIESLSVFLTIVFASVAVLLIFASALFYCLRISELIKTGLEMGAPLMKTLSPGLKRQFFAGLLGGIFSSAFFYLADLFYGVNIFSYETAALVSLLTGILSLPIFTLICLSCLKD